EALQKEQEEIAQREREARQKQQEEDAKNRREMSTKLRKFAYGLPIYDFRSRILDALSNHDFLIVVAETGSGKTTQIPQFLLDSGRFGSRIAITQPRR
ncbi:unnamed protein product, partial [Amoebophrya sp. A25]